MKKAKIIHIGIIIAGIIFSLIPAFHTNMWFDESYSAAIAEHGFFEIWQITGHDVHPILYYWILHIVYLIFGNSILAFRLCSVVGLALLGIVGYTHVRKDFGGKVGAIFSTFVFFLPTTLMYVTEIRMYTWAMLFVTLMCIYGYRLYKGAHKWQNWVLFGAMALASAYTHYYGLVAAGIVNAMLFIGLLIPCIKQKKFLKEMKSYIITGVVEILVYLPWLIYLALQLSQVSQGFWIGFKFPDTLIELFIFQFTGSLGGNARIVPIVGTVFAIFMAGCFITYLVKNWKEPDSLPAKLILIMYGLVLAVAVVVSLCASPILYPRYLLVITGPLLIAMAYAFSKMKNEYVKIIFIVFFVEMAIYGNISLTSYNYEKTNDAPFAYLEEKVQENDIFIWENQLNGFVVAVHFPEHQQYFWNRAQWNVEEAYKAYGSMTTINNLENLDAYAGRIWIADNSNYDILSEMKKKYGDDHIKVIEKEGFDTKYQDGSYRFALIEKTV